LIEKLSTIVRSVAQSNEARSDAGQRSSQNTPTPWDGQTARERPRSRESSARGAPQRDNRDSRESQPYASQQRDQREPSQRDRMERYGSTSGRSHGRQESTGTGQASSHGDYGESGARRHDYDLDAMETDLSSPRTSFKKNPIPPPQLTLRSEYPSLSRSKYSQTLTCLIMVEVPEGRWKPSPEELGPPPPLLSAHDQEKEVVRPRTPEEDSQNAWMNESPEELEEVTQDLRERVENWHGLDFARYACRLTGWVWC